MSADAKFFLIVLGVPFGLIFLVMLPDFILFLLNQFGELADHWYEKWRDIRNWKQDRKWYVENKRR